MKILIECLWPIEAGSVFSYGMAKGLKENGQDVFCVLTEDVENTSQWVETFGLSNLFFLQTLPRKSSPVTSGIRFLSDCLSLKRKFGHITFDFAVSTFPNTYELLILNFVQSRKKISICHDPVPHSNMDEKARSRFVKRMRQFDDFIVMTRAFIPILKENYRISDDHVFYMRHGLMEYRHTREKDPSADPQKGINFLFFGRILEYKGLHLLADSYRLVSDQYKNVSLTVAGNGNFDLYRDEYRSLPNVRIVNRYIENDEIEKFFDTGNTVIVLPYLDSTQSGVIPVAFDFCVPVIASDTEGLSEQLFDGTYGILFENGNRSALAEAMLEFLRSPEKYESESKKMQAGRQALKWRNVTRELLDQFGQHHDPAEGTQSF